MSTVLQLDDFGLEHFAQLAASFGQHHYGYVVTPNVDHVIRYWDEASFREFYAGASFVLLDSRFLARLLGAIKGLHLQTCPGSDLTALLFDRIIAPDDKVVLIGGTASQAQALAQQRGLRALRHYDPPMGFIHDPAAVEECLRFIEQESPFRFCLLAVGCPRQELLAYALKQRARARGLALCIGASINFLTGVERRAPAWMQRLGIEWLHRLLQHPARLAGRYLVRGPRIFLLLPRITFELRMHSSPSRP